jgi:hypothetical protein
MTADIHSDFEAGSLATPAVAVAARASTNTPLLIPAAIESMLVVDLQAELKRRGLPSKGKKAQLIAALTEALRTAGGPASGVRDSAALSDAREAAFELMRLLDTALSHVHNTGDDAAHFRVCWTGRGKNLLNRFKQEIVHSLRAICHAPVHILTLRERQEFIAKTRRAVGRTALCLSGGGVLAMCVCGPSRILVCVWVGVGGWVWVCVCVCVCVFVLQIMVFCGVVSEKRTASAVARHFCELFVCATFA